MLIIRVLLAIALGIGFIAGAVFNFGVLWRALVSKKRGPSGLPILAGVAGALAMLVLPSSSARRYAWLPLVLDYGCLPHLVSCSIYLTVDAWRHSRVNLISRYVAKVGDRRTATLSFFKSDFVLQQDFHRQPGEEGIISIGTEGKWQETPERFVLQLDEEQLVLQKEGATLHQVGAYPPYDKNHEISLAGLTFEKTS